MSGQEQLFSAYRDLGIEQATHGQFRAHVVRIKKESAGNPAAAH